MDGDNVGSVVNDTHVKSQDIGLWSPEPDLISSLRRCRKICACARSSNLNQGAQGKDSARTLRLTREGLNKTSLGTIYFSELGEFVDGGQDLPLQDTSSIVTNCRAANGQI